MDRTKEIRCVTESGRTVYLPEKFAKDPAYMRKHNLTIQDQEEERKNFVVPASKQEDESLELLTEDENISTSISYEEDEKEMVTTVEEKPKAKPGPKPKNTTEKV